MKKALSNGGFLFGGLSGDSDKKRGRGGEIDPSTEREAGEGVRQSAILW